MKKICYTGIGSKTKNGTHTSDEFVNIANKKFKTECSIFIKSKKCKPCKKYNKVLKNTFKITTKSKKFPSINKYNKLLEKCDQCKETDLVPCDLDSYIDYSGAEFGPCKKMRGGGIKRNTYKKTKSNKYKSNKSKSNKKKRKETYRMKFK